MRGITAPLLFIFIVALTSPIVALAQPAGSTDHYNEGLEAYKSSRYRDALALFEKAKFQYDEDDLNFAIVHYNLGRCVQKIVHETPDRELSCLGVQWFKAYLKLTRSEKGGKSRDRAKRGLAKLRAHCPAQKTWTNSGARATGSEQAQAQAPTAHRGRSAIPTVLTGLGAALLAGGIGLQVQYSSILGDRDTAFNAFKGAEDQGTRDAREIDVRELEIEAASLSAASWSLMGAGAAVGVVALFAWLKEQEDEEMGLSSHPVLRGPPGTLTWTW